MVIWGQGIGYKMKLLPSFIGQALTFICIPFLTNIGGDVAYYSVLTLLIVFGVFLGLGYGTVYALAA